MEEKEKLEYIAGNIRACRARVGLSGNECAKKLGVSRQAYSRYETNPAKVKVDTLDKIASILNCKLSDFFKE